MSRSSGFYMCCTSLLSICGALSAQAATQGRVVDIHGGPVIGATVHSFRLQQITTTNETGYFSFSPSRLQHSSRTPQTTNRVVMGKNIKITLEKDVTPVTIRAYTVSGRLIANSTYSNLPKGSHLLPLIRSGESAAKTIITQVLIDGERQPQTIAPSFPTISSQTLSSDTTDTLQISKTGFLQKRMRISSNDRGPILLYSEELDFTYENFPKLDGSTTGISLGVIAACSLLKISYEWGSRHDGLSIAHPSSGNRVSDSAITAMTQFSTTHYAYENIIRGTRDIGLIARLPSADEIRTAESLGIALDVEPLAMDAFIFLAHARNPVSSVTLDQMKSVYSGGIRHWDQLGSWTDCPISPYIREPNSGSQELFVKLVMQQAPLDKRIPVINGMFGVYGTLDNDTAGLCFTVYYYHSAMIPSFAVKAVAIDGVYPSPEAIRDRRFPLWSYFYIVTRKNIDPTSRAAHLREWFLAPQGQRVVRQSGYVALLPDADPN